MKLADLKKNSRTVSPPNVVDGKALHAYGLFFELGNSGFIFHNYQGA